MNAHTMIVADTAPDIRPRSAVSAGVGFTGLFGLFAWFAIAKSYGMDGPLSGLMAVVWCGVPMILWSLIVDRVHRNPSTGIDWDSPLRPLSETLDISLVKLAGLWATWGMIAVFYCVGRWYWAGNYLFSMQVLTAAAPILAVASVPYVLWIDRRLRDPRDGAHAFGQWLIGQGVSDRALLHDHFRSWAVKGFFTAFMLSIVPGAFGDLVRTSWAQMTENPVILIGWLITAMFMVDIAFATVGYALTFKPLDSHIRSANPYAAGWTAALICYPPFIMMGNGGPLDYHQGTAEWTHWLAAHQPLAIVLGVVLVLLTAIYAWATVAFGLRFSNLTHRGVLTHGPYAWTKHPAYLSKNAFWWLSTLPFLATTNNPIDAVRNTFIMAAVAGVYYWRARTEEKHLGADPAYRIYAEWMERNAPIPRLIRLISGKKP